MRPQSRGACPTISGPAAQSSPFPASTQYRLQQGVRSMRSQGAAVKPFDVTRLEDEVRDAAQQRPHIQAIDYVPRTLPPPPPVPDYVVHREDISEIGKLSAEAIVKEYEETAKEIEARGGVVREMVQRCEQLTATASAMLKDIK